MSLVTAKPTFVENLFHTFFNLQPDRPMYYLHVYRLTRSIFLNLGQDEKAEELDMLIRERIEKPYNANFIHLINAYYNPRFMFKRNAFCKVGDRIDYLKVTRYDIYIKLEGIKNWCYDELSTLANDVRFTAIMQIPQ